MREPTCSAATVRRESVALPDLPTPIGLAGAMRHPEATGALSLETSVLVATMIYTLVER